MLRRLTFCVGIAIVTSGCGNANWTSIYRSYSPESEDGKRGTSALIDAKQRTIIAASRTNDVIVCAEPSPDALSAVSSSFAGSTSVSTQSSPEVALAMALALNEAAGQLRRARTVQLLRDSLFRACEAYMNQAMDEIDYTRIANKYADATVTLLAIEQLTSPDTGAATIIAPGGTQAQSEATVPAQPEGGQPARPEGEQPAQPEGGQPTQPGGGQPAQPEGGQPAQPEAGGSATSGASTTPPPPDGGGGPTGLAAAGVSNEVANVVGDLVSQFLRSNVQNSCIEFFSKDVYIPPDLSRAELDEAAGRFNAIRKYCDVVFGAIEAQTEIRREERSGQPSAASKLPSPTLLMEQMPEN